MFACFSQQFVTEVRIYQSVFKATAKYFTTVFQHCCKLYHQILLCVYMYIYSAYKVQKYYKTSPDYIESDILYFDGTSV